MGTSGVICGLLLPALASRTVNWVGQNPWLFQLLSWALWVQTAFILWEHHRIFRLWYLWVSYKYLQIWIDRPFWFCFYDYSSEKSSQQRMVATFSNMIIGTLNNFGHIFHHGGLKTTEILWYSPNPRWNYDLIYLVSWSFFSFKNVHTVSWRKTTQMPLCSPS